MFIGILIVCVMWFLVWGSNELLGKVDKPILRLLLSVMCIASFVIGIVGTFALPANYYGAINQKITMETTQQVFDEARAKFDRNESPVCYLENLGITETIAKMNSDLARFQYYASETFWRFFMCRKVVMSIKPLK